MSDLGRAACVAQDAAGSKPLIFLLEIVMYLRRCPTPGCLIIASARSGTIEPQGRHALGVFCSDQSASLIGINAVRITLLRVGSPFDATAFPVR